MQILVVRNEKKSRSEELELLTIFSKWSTLDVWQGSKYASV